jgi:hypothetical protein
VHNLIFFLDFSAAEDDTKKTRFSFQQQQQQQQQEEEDEFAFTGIHSTFFPILEYKVEVIYRIHYPLKKYSPSIQKFTFFILFS